MKLECANCRQVFDKDDEILTITDNQLIFRYFDRPDGRDNAFCSEECLCDALMAEYVSIDEFKKMYKEIDEE